MTIAEMQGVNPLAKPLRGLMKYSKRYWLAQCALWDLEQAKGDPAEIRALESKVEYAELEFLQALQKCPGSSLKIPPQKTKVALKKRNSVP